MLLTLKTLNKLRLVVILFTGLILVSCDRQDKAIAEINAFIAKANIDTSKEGWKLAGVPKPQQVEFTKDTQYLWHLQTNKGNITIDFKEQESPMHVTSTIYLTNLGFYDDILFHRVIPGFMAQGGDPVGVGVGGPGYTYLGEFDSDLSHDKAGILSMANSGAGTDGSQFFITFRPTLHLDGRHTIFGEVIEGMETLQELAKFGSRSGKTKEKLYIKKATVEVR
jgi:peptidyl-prolyl cis-trans isomerase B (cyclophilin B)